MTTDSEVLLLQFAEVPYDIAKQEELAATLICSDTEMLASAECIYLAHCAARNHKVDQDFRAKFVRAWSAFTRNALSRIGPALADSVQIDLGPTTSSLYVLWHFPEYPLLLPELLRRDVVVAVAQDSEWLQPLAKAGLAVNFTRIGGRMALRRACESGRSVAMMVDYCYEGTRHHVSDFLGLPCKTPSGLVQMAYRFGLDVRLVSCNGESIHTEGAPNFPNPAECLAWLNWRISALIESEPSRWLLWPSLNTRVLPADDAAQLPSTPKPIE